MKIDTVVVGAGPAGLATSRELARRGVPHVVLERGDRVGYSWSRFYDSLVLHTGRHLSRLPGLRFPAGTPLFPTRIDFVNYLDRYAAQFNLPVTCGAEVGRIERLGDEWAVVTREGDGYQAHAVVVATGIAANPHRPDFPGLAGFRGRVRHSVEYKNPVECAGRRVLVIGVGNSAGEIATEISRAGGHVTLSVRNGALILPRQVLGVPIQYVALPLGYLPRTFQQRVGRMIGAATAFVKGKPVLPPPNPQGCVRVPLIGLQLGSRIQEGLIQLNGDIGQFTPDGVRFTDGSEQPFNEVILATGYRAAMGMLDGLIRTDRCGFALRRGPVASAELPNLYFVGHNPDVRGGIFRIGRDARRTAALIAGKTARVARTRL